MKKLFLLILLSFFTLQMKAQSPEATWIWYPGDFELWLSSKMQTLRTERGMFYGPFWRMDRHTQLITFDKTVELTEPETVEFYVEGQFYLTIDGRFIYNPKGKIDIPAGKHTIHFQVYNQETPPALWLKGKTVVSDKSWIATRQDRMEVKADSWNFDKPENKPSQYKLATEPKKAAKVEKKTGSTLVDFGQETFGFIKLHQLKGTGTLTIIYGESEEEAKAGWDAETYDIIEVSQPNTADYTVKHSKAFRYANISTSGNLSFEDVSMLYEYIPLDYKGSFRCSDEEINKIWDISAYTFHLSTREFFIDGIKRDRWIWSGDAYQSYLMNYYLFFDNPLVKRTTWALRGNDPVVMHMNSILDYSMYWFMGIYDYYLYTGDKEFVSQIYPKMISMMDFCLGRRNAEGMMEGLPGDWVFVDWAPMTKDGELSIEQLLFCRSLETMVLCANLMNDDENAKKYQKLAGDLRTKIMDVFWDDSQKALVHRRIKGKVDNTVTRYANMFAMTFDYLNAKQKEDVKNHVILNDKVQKITTPYMRFYELEAMCRVGQHKYVLNEMRNYWGGMLKLGATSFWEAYDPTQKGAKHYAMYDRPFGKSLCHAWGASPLYLLGKYYLGVSPTAPGYEKYTVEPELGDLKWIKGTVPTPSGNIEISVNEKQINIKTIDGEGILRFKSTKKPSCKTAEIKLITDGYYEMILKANTAYDIKYVAKK